MQRITNEDANRRLAEHPGWILRDGALQRQFTFEDFPHAVAYLVRLGFAAESVDHHPDILINYKRVTLTYVTHSAGGLTDKDFEGAKTAGRLAEEMGGR